MGITCKDPTVGRAAEDERECRCLVKHRTRDHASRGR